MLFNSIPFAIFLPCVFTCYWLLKGNFKAQNLLLLLTSYYFYACWDYRFLLLLCSSVSLDFWLGKKIYSAASLKKKNRWLWLSVSVNLSVLILFKYSNFFIQSFAGVLAGFNVKVNPGTLNLILPLGISFYTFHELSYIIDIYKGRIKPADDYVEYSLFVTFFPLLVAGPIERATHLLPQLQKKRTFDYARATDGLRQILWGFFKKIVIADNCADFVNAVFDHTGKYPGSAHLVAAVFFAFQIYCDFSGYSDIALGVARLFGIELLKNFNYPYFSRDIAEFWRRWHMSLTSWFRDYVYIPLGGSRGKLPERIRNTLIVFIVSGFWHGANWTFLFWGALNAVYFVPLLVFNKNRNHIGVVAEGRLFATLSEFLRMMLTFSLTVFAWIFFRSPNLSDAFSYIRDIFQPSLFSSPQFYTSTPLKLMLLVLLLFFMVEWIGRNGNFALERTVPALKKWQRWAIYIFLTGMIFVWYKKPQEFIYFHF